MKGSRERPSHPSHVHTQHTIEPSRTAQAPWASVARSDLRVGILWHRAARSDGFPRCLRARRARARRSGCEGGSCRRGRRGSSGSALAGARLLGREGSDRARSHSLHDRRAVHLAHSECPSPGAWSAAAGARDSGLRAADGSSDQLPALPPRTEPLPASGLGLAPDRRQLTPGSGAPRCPLFVLSDLIRRKRLRWRPKRRARSLMVVHAHDRATCRDAHGC